MDVWDEARGHLSGLPDGAGLNIAYETVERHVVQGRGDHPAFRFIGADRALQVVSYAELSRLSNRFANALGALGVKAGESVFAMAGRVPATYIAGLGALKTRAMFSALYANFGEQPAKTRLEKGHGRLLVTTPQVYERRIAGIRDSLPELEHVVVTDSNPPPGTLAWQELLDGASDQYTIPPTDPEDIAFLQFTSGTTGSPKGALHAHAAAIVQYDSARRVLALHPDDVYWCTADPGWVTGISFGLVAPLLHGATAIIDEGDFDPVRWYQIIQDHRVTVWYTAPTAIRMLMKAGSRVARSFDLSSLRLIASAGEPLNPEAVRWGRQAFGQDIHDTWWQTETGAIMIGTPVTEEVVLGAMGRPLPGIEAGVARRQTGRPVEIVTTPNQVGELVLKSGWPSMFRGYLDEPELYADCFAEGWYFTGDLVSRDGDDRFWFVSRGDEVIKSAGQLIGPYEVENSLLEHPAVAEAAVIGKPDRLVGDVVKAFVVLKDGFTADEDLRLELLGFARKRLGPALAPREITFSRTLPKTRNGKIVRRLLRARELGLSDADLPVLETPDAAGID